MASSAREHASAVAPKPSAGRSRISERNRRARALTVFQSPRLERFEIELIGDFPDGGVSGVDLILGRAYGSRIEEFGGVPAGASGSPVYVGERLIGAVSYVFPPDFRLVGITPIELMRRLAHEPRSDHRSPRLGDGGGSPESKPTPAALVWPAGLAPACAGFRSPRVLRFFKERFAVEPVPITLPPAAQAATRPIGPGSPIGLPLIDGDFRMGAIGTATSVEGENVLGLGHPAYFSGAVRLPLTEATIVTTSGGLGPVKIGYMGRTAGAVIQDRAAGILAVIGLLPETVELTMEITETDRHVQERLTVQLAPLPDWIPFLTFIATVEGFARVMNRVGSGEAAWEWSVDVAGADQPIREEATEYSPTDIGATVAQAGEALLSRLVGERAVVERIRLEATVHL